MSHLCCVDPTGLDVRLSGPDEDMRTYARCWSTLTGWNVGVSGGMLTVSEIYSYRGFVSQVAQVRAMAWSIFIHENDEVTKERFIGFASAHGAATTAQNRFLEQINSSYRFIDEYKDCSILEKNGDSRGYLLNFTRAKLEALHHGPSQGRTSPEAYPYNRFRVIT